MCFLKLYQNSDKLFLFYIHGDWPNDLCAALSWVSSKLRIYAQGLRTSPVFKSQDDSDSRYRLRYVTWTYSKKTTTDSTEQEKTQGGISFSILYSPRSISPIRDLLLTNATFECFSSSKKKKRKKKINFCSEEIFFNNSKVTKIAVIENNQIIRIMEITFRNTVIKIMGNKQYVYSQCISSQINPTKRFDKRKLRRISWGPFISRQLPTPVTQKS